VTVDQISMEDVIAVVTGAGRGLGRAYCIELARRGAAVVVNDIHRQSADQVVSEITVNGGRAVASYETVSTEAGGRAIVDAAIKEFGTVTAIVNNAGTMRNGYFEELAVDALEAMLDVHVRGSWFVTQAAWPVMRDRRFGRVVMTSSTAGLFAMQAQANYCAAKAAVYGLCKALAFEGDEHGIAVNAVLPAATTTIAADSPVPDMDKYATAGVREAMAPWRQAELVAPFIAYLSSRACNVTGEAFAVGFGRYARVFVGETHGWIAKDPQDASAEEIVEHLDEIRDPEAYFVPANLHEETAAVAERILSVRRR
jgi:NAD(P)-dependent dehydrogenase (short-subunit alcohol dehydrogenase family)